MQNEQRHLPRGLTDFVRTDALQFFLGGTSSTPSFATCTPPNLLPAHPFHIPFLRNTLQVVAYMP